MSPHARARTDLWRWRRHKLLLIVAALPLLVGGAVTAAIAAPPHPGPVRPVATPDPDCTLTIPDAPLTARGLATAYILSATTPVAGPCHEANTAQSAFVQATIYDPATGALVGLRSARHRRRPTSSRHPDRADAAGRRRGRDLVRLQRKQPHAPFRRRRRSRAQPLRQRARRLRLRAVRVLRRCRVLLRGQDRDRRAQGDGARARHRERRQAMPEHARFLDRRPRPERQRHHAIPGHRVRTHRAEHAGQRRQTARSHGAVQPQRQRAAWTRSSTRRSAARHGPCAISTAAAPRPPSRSTRSRRTPTRPRRSRSCRSTTR